MEERTYTPEQIKAVKGVVDQLRGFFSYIATEIVPQISALQWSTFRALRVQLPPRLQTDIDTDYLSTMTPDDSLTDIRDTTLHANIKRLQGILIVNQTKDEIFKVLSSVVIRNFLLPDFQILVASFRQKLMDVWVGIESINKIADITGLNMRLEKDKKKYLSELLTEFQVDLQNISKVLEDALNCDDSTDTTKLSSVSKTIFNKRYD